MLSQGRRGDDGHRGDKGARGAGGKDFNCSAICDPSDDPTTGAPTSATDAPTTSATTEAPEPCELAVSGSANIESPDSTTRVVQCARNHELLCDSEPCGGDARSATFEARNGTWCSTDLSVCTCEATCEPLRVSAVREMEQGSGIDRLSRGGP